MYGYWCQASGLSIQHLLLLSGQKHLRNPAHALFYLAVRLWWAGWHKCLQRGCEVLCRIHHMPPHPSCAGGLTAQLDALWWEPSGSWTAGTHMLKWNTAQVHYHINRFKCEHVVLCGTVSYIICSDPVGFLVTEYLGEDPVQLQHQFVN